jgi:7-cyano-7-deazaguanine synthase
VQRSMAVVLVSGGMDSCVTAAFAAQDNDLAFLHINYGQRTEKKELEAFNDIADFFKAKQRQVVDISHLTKIGGSSLTDRSIEISPADLDNTEIPTSYVPFRNANILVIATSWAEVLKAEKIYIGAVEEDSSGYPDCRDGFFKAFNRVIELGTKPETSVEIVTPLINMSKKEIILKGMNLNAPLDLTWSCYQNEELACGECDSCALRLRGFSQAGLEDPIPYEIRPEY